MYLQLQILFSYNYKLVQKNLILIEFKDHNAIMKITTEITLAYYDTIFSYKIVLYYDFGCNELTQM